MDKLMYVIVAILIGLVGSWVYLLNNSYDNSDKISQELKDLRVEKNKLEVSSLSVEKISDKKVLAVKDLYEEYEALEDEMEDLRLPSPEVRATYESRIEKAMDELEKVIYANR